MAERLDEQSNLWALWHAAGATGNRSHSPRGGLAPCAWQPTQAADMLERVGPAGAEATHIARLSDSFNRGGTVGTR